MQPAISQIGESKCTGCYACYHSCPTKAVTMSLNGEGFLVPSIDFTKCTNCGLCQQYCPAINIPEKEDIIQPQLFAASSNDQENRLQSSSGGIFYELANQIIKSDGVVFGAIFDKDFTLHHICCEKKDDLQNLRGSKYVQSRINNAYELAILFANQNKPVLFCGTPCQVAALNNCVRKIDQKKISRNIYSCDLICHGVASDLVFKKYLRYLAQKRKSQIVAYHFRNKQLGWQNYGSYALFEDNSQYFQVHRMDLFMVGYLKNIFLRDACYACSFARIPRQSDITLGDFWGAPKNLYDSRGVSVVLVNSSKGKDLFDKITSISRNPITMAQVAPYNIRLTNGMIKKPIERTAFFKMIDTVDFEKLAQKYFPPPPKIREYSLRILSIIKHTL